MARKISKRKTEVVNTNINANETAHIVGEAETISVDICIDEDDGTVKIKIVDHDHDNHKCYVHKINVHDTENISTKFSMESSVEDLK
jgi:multisubunit Na+/H+ antiporter MnhE subunit